METLTTVRIAETNAGHIRICQHCHVPYDWRRSPSDCLKMTYCGSLCEIADLGFSIESLLHAERSASGS